MDETGADGTESDRSRRKLPNLYTKKACPHQTLTCGCHGECTTPSPLSMSEHPPCRIVSAPHPSKTRRWPTAACSFKDCFSIANHKLPFSYNILLCGHPLLTKACE